MPENYFSPKDKQQFYAKTVGDGCQLCGSQDNLVIDHNHTSQRIRGLLCTRHNTGIGMFRDDPEMLEKAATYLRVSSLSEPTWLATFAPKKRVGSSALLQATLTLMSDPTFPSDRARARALAQMFPIISYRAAQCRITRLRSKSGQ